MQCNAMLLYNVMQWNILYEHSEKAHSENLTTLLWCTDSNGKGLIFSCTCILPHPLTSNVTSAVIYGIVLCWSNATMSVELPGCHAFSHTYPSLPAAHVQISRTMAYPFVPHPLYVEYVNKYIFIMWHHHFRLLSTAEHWKRLRELPTRWNPTHCWCRGHLCL